MRGVTRRGSGPLVAGDPDWERLLAAFRARPGLLDAGPAALAAASYPGDASDVLVAADRARKIDDRTVSGDPAWIRELNRLQHLPLLAQAWMLTGDDRYAEEALSRLDGWIAVHPSDGGVARRGAFEAGIRAISVVATLKGLRRSAALTPARYRDAVRLLDASARRCLQERSPHSPANNHLVGELAGLAVVAIAVPELAEARAWERRALDDLVREADRRILADGAGADHAIGHQVFTSDLLAVVLLALRIRDSRDGRHAAALARALDRGASYLCTRLGDSDEDGDGDPAPPEGDDGDVALRLDAAPVRTPRAHLATVAALTGNEDAARCGRPDLAAAWFARGARASTAVAPAHPPAGLAVVLGHARRAWHRARS